MDKAKKREFVSWLNGTLKKAGSVVVARYSGLTVTQMNDFRSKTRVAGGFVKVAKNRLVKIALRGTEMEIISSLFTGQTVVVWSSDPITAPKVAVEFSKLNEKLIILGGAMGTTGIDANEVKSLALLPSMDELRAKLIGIVSMPATRITQVVSAPAAQLARVFGVYAHKNEIV